MAYIIPMYIVYLQGRLGRIISFWQDHGSQDRLSFFGTGSGGSAKAH
jgi:hypothetical protein